MKTPTLKELADIGAKASYDSQMITDGTYAVYMLPSKYPRDEPARQSFARAVKDAVEKPLLERINELEVATALPTADGKTPGQVMCETGCRGVTWETTPKALKDQHEKAASAVLAAFGRSDLQDAIARMEAVPMHELIEAYCEGPGTGGMGEALRAVRARLISAAREGQPDAVNDESPPNWEVRFRVAQHRAEQLVDQAAKAETRADKAEAEPSLAPPPPPWHPAVGDVVKLASGGPAMTVGEIKDAGIGCDWFDEFGQWHGMLFNTACLQPAKEGQP